MEDCWMIERYEVYCETDGSGWKYTSPRVVASTYTLAAAVDNAVHGVLTSKRRLSHYSIKGPDGRMYAVRSGPNGAEAVPASPSTP
jgi:hypothetical protein